MPKSIAEMRQSPHVGRPQATARICVAGKLQAQLDQLDREFIDAKSRAEEAEAEIAMFSPVADEQDDKPKKPRRLTDKVDPELRARAAQYRALAEEKAAAADEILEQMNDHMVEVDVMARESGEWRQFCLEHPARDDERRDMRNLAGICNADDLVANLEAYVVALNGAPPGTGDWEWVAKNAAPAALLEVAAKVVGLHETVVSLGKSRLAWLNGQTKSNGSDSPSQSEPASDD